MRSRARAFTRFRRGERGSVWIRPLFSRAIEARAAWRWDATDRLADEALRRPVRHEDDPEHDEIDPDADRQPGQVEWRLPILRRVYIGLARDVRFVQYDGRGTGRSQRDVADLSLEHRGCTSGRTYRGPVVVIKTADGFLVPLPFGAATQWATNVLAPTEPPSAGIAATARRPPHRSSTARPSFNPILRRLVPLTGIREFVLLRDADADVGAA